MNTRKQTQISILGGVYFQPIADLIARLIIYSSPRLNAVQSSPYENGYCVSITLLLVAMLESYLVRLRYFQRSRILSNDRSAFDILLRVYPKFPYRKSLSDVFVLRDSIFHNHLWEIKYSWKRSPVMVLHNASKDPSSGDRKWISRVNPNTRRTKALRLHVVPTRVDRRDAFKVFDTVWKTLLFLERNDRLHCYVSHLDVDYQGEMILFGDLMDKLKNSL